MSTIRPTIEAKTLEFLKNKLDQVPIQDIEPKANAILGFRDYFYAEKYTNHTGKQSEFFDIGDSWKAAVEVGPNDEVLILQNPQLGIDKSIKFRDPRVNSPDSKIIPGSFLGYINNSGNQLNLKDAVSILDRIIEEVTRESNQELLKPKA